MSGNPLGWRAVLLGDVITPSSVREVPRPDKRLPFIGMEHVEAHTGRVLERADASTIKSASPVVEKGDVLYGRLRPYLNKVAIAPERAYASGEFIVFRQNKDVDARWLKWRLTASDFVDYAVSLNAGDRPRVKWPQMQSFGLLLPALHDQRRIVEILEDHIEALARAEEQMVAVLQRLDVLERSVHQLALRGELVADDLSLGTGDDLLAGAASLDPAALEERSWAIPSAWTWSRIGDLFSVSVGATPSRGDALLWDGDIPWVSSGEVAFNRIKATRETIAPSAVSGGKRLHPPGTVMLAMIGEGKTRGQTAILDIEAAHNQNCASIRVSETRILPEYVFAFFKERYLETRRGSSGGNQPALNKGRIQGIPIPVPPLGTQRLIVEELDRFATSGSYLRKSCRRSLERVNSLRTALLTAAFEGRLTGRHTDDEVIEERAEALGHKESTQP